jgi:ribonuclease-3
LNTTKSGLVSSINEIEDIIKYTFKNKNLLLKAFTHSSFTHDKSLTYERLEFLGDALLDFVVAEYLYKNYPEKDEGDYTLARSEVVDTNSLFREISQMGLIDYLLIGNKSLNTDISSGKNKKLYADLYESVLCAIYLDGGINEAKRFIYDTLSKELNEAVLCVDFRNYKTTLKEAGEKRRFNIEYVLDRREGTDNAPVYYYSVLIDGKKMGEGYGTSVKEAENYAAKRALKNLKLLSE